MQVRRVLHQLLIYNLEGHVPLAGYLVLGKSPGMTGKLHAFATFIFDIYYFQSHILQHTN